tara:strand:+ start:1012 stop:3423 length:2412 start_codon:yes stop_codon:yes gene_type:complete
MPTVLKFRRGTTAQNDAFTGAAGEISIDTQTDNLRIHDGSTAGGFEVTRNTATQTLTNKTLTTPTLTTPVINTGADLKNGSTSAGFLKFFEDSDNGTNAVTLIGPASTADVTLTLPAATDTLVGKATTDTLTNKTLTTPTIDQINSSGFTLDSSGDINLDADGADVIIKDGGTEIGRFTNSSSDFVIKSAVSDKDMVFKGNDGGSEVTALTLDMSAAGNATFAADLTVTGNFTVNGTTNTLNTTNTVVSDRLIELGNGTTGSPSNDMGIVLERGDSDNAFIGFDESTDEFVVGTGSFTGASTGNLTIAKGVVASSGNRIYDSDGSHYIALTAPAISSNQSFVLPATDGSSNQVIVTDGSGNLSFTSVNAAAGAGLSNVVEDTSPQLGANLDTNSHNILIDDAHFIADENGNEQIIFQTTSSAVNQIDVTNAATGNGPSISATGGDTNIDLNLTPKGTGQVVIDGNVGIDTGVIDLKNGGSQSVVRFYCESSNAHYAQIQAPAHSDFSGNVTLTLPASTDTLAGIAATQTLTNKTLTTPTINAGADLKNGSTSAGFLKFFEDSDNGTNAVTLIGPASTADVTLTLPAAADTLVGKATTDTLTNKTINGPDNTLTNIPAGQLTGTVANARLDAQLQDVAGLAVTDGGFIVGDGSNFVLETGATARASLALDTGNDVQFDSLGVATAASGTSGEIRATNDITAFYSSDVALKENIDNIPNPMDMVSKLNGVLFDWKDSFIESKGGEDGYFVRKRDVGVVAQDVESVLPEIVGTRPDGIKAVKYDRLCALLIECVKDLQDQVNNLKK